MTGGPDAATLQAGGLEFSALVDGPDDGDVVVLVHGFPDTPATFRHQIDAFADAGYRVVAPCLRGYEPSSQPADGDYDLMTLAGDVVGWLDDLDVQRAHLVGHDWGAAITYVVAAHHGDRVLSATTIAVPPLTRIPDGLRKVPRQLVRAWYMIWFQFGRLAERSVQARDWSLMRRLCRSWSPNESISDDDWSTLVAAFEQPGVVTSALSYYRQNATPPILTGIRQTPAMVTTPIDVPTLVINGVDDGCMDRRLFDAAVAPDDFPQGVERLEVSEAGHFVHRERPDVVNDAILRFIASE